MDPEKRLQLNSENILTTPDQVRGLSLHEISEQFGTEGLFVRLEDTLKLNNLYDEPGVWAAVQMGLSLHAADKRTSGNYNDHLMRVAIRIIDYFGITDPSIVKAAMLHDSVEDHAIDIVHLLGGHLLADNIQEEALRCYSKSFDSETVEIIRQVTNPRFTSGQKLEEYETHTLGIVLNYPKARVVKLADFIDNAVGNHYTTGEKQLSLDNKYLTVYRLHLLGLYLPDSLITGDARTGTHEKLERGRFRALSRLALAS